MDKKYYYISGAVLIVLIAAFLTIHIFVVKSKSAKMITYDVMTAPPPPSIDDAREPVAVPDTDFIGGEEH